MNLPVSIIRIILFLLWTLACIPVQAFYVLFNLPQRYTFPVFFDQVLCRIIMGIKIVKQGEISAHKPLLFVGNHLSYMDIIAISSIMPCSFVSKAEVANWPLIGYMAKLQNTIFVNRNAPRLVKQQGQEIADALNVHTNLVIFPEGTSSIGETVLPFKSSLLEVAVNKTVPDLRIQPIAIKIEHKGGQARRYPWYEEEESFVSHLIVLMGMIGLTITITFLPPVDPSTFTDRKELANYLREQILTAPFGTSA